MTTPSDTTAAPPETGSAETGPSGTGPSGAGPSGTGPSGTGPSGTGPSGTGPDLPPSPEPRRRRRRLRRLPLVLLVLLVVAGLLAAGAGIRGLVDRPVSDGSVDAGFARDMSIHHAQAVAMAMTELDRGADPDVRAVARDIALSQQREIGVMATWLQSWGLSQSSSRAPMSWMREVPGGMDHAHGGSGDLGTMPGLATTAELVELSSASGRAADVLFAQLMIRHHRGGLTMAQEAALTASDPDVRALARAMVVNQSNDIEVMQSDLRRLGAPPA